MRDIHGDLDQSQRTQALDAFKRGEIDFLVATDVAARGLDIVSLPCVINYDVPTHADDYVHRIGRTGRAGQEGRAFTLILPEERRYVDAITRLTGKEIPRLEIPGAEAAARASRRASGRRFGAARRAMAAPAPESSRASGCRCGAGAAATARPRRPRRRSEAPPAMPPRPGLRRAAATASAQAARGPGGRHG